MLELTTKGLRRNTKENLRKVAKNLLVNAEPGYVVLNERTGKFTVVDKFSSLFLLLFLESSMVFRLHKTRKTWFENFQALFGFKNRDVAVFYKIVNVDGKKYIIDTNPTFASDLFQLMPTFENLLHVEQQRTENFTEARLAVSAAHNVEKAANGGGIDTPHSPDLYLQPFSLAKYNVGLRQHFFIEEDKLNVHRVEVSEKKLCREVSALRELLMDVLNCKSLPQFALAKNLLHLSSNFTVGSTFRFLFNKAVGFKYAQSLGRRIISCEGVQYRNGSLFRVKYVAPLPSPQKNQPCSCPSSGVVVCTKRQKCLTVC